MGGGEQEKGMPLGNLTSQFFANVYLNELDYFVKHQLKAKYYIRYVDDFVLLHNSKERLSKWKEEINHFLKDKMSIELHPDKSKIIPLSKPISFLGLRVFYHYKLLKRFNRRHIFRKLKLFHILLSEDKIDYDKIYGSVQGSFDYMNYANTYRLRSKLFKQMEEKFSNQISSIEINRYLKSMNPEPSESKMHSRPNK